MKFKNLVAASVVLSLFFLFTGTGFCAGDGKVTMEQWLKIINSGDAKKSPPPKTTETKETNIKDDIDSTAPADARGIAVTVYWHMADDADVYLNGKSLRNYEPSFKTRGDEAPRPAFAASAILRDGDVFTVGGRRGGSFGLMLIVVDPAGRIVFQTDQQSWKVYEPGDRTDWYNPQVALSSPTQPVTVQSDPWYPQKELNAKYGNKALSIWSTPASTFAYLYGVVGGESKTADRTIDVAPKVQAKTGGTETATAKTDQAGDPRGSITAAGMAPPAKPMVAPMKGGQDNSGIQHPGYDPPARPADGILKEDDPCKPNLNIGDLVWSTAQSQPGKNASAQDNKSKFNDLLIFSDTRYNHPVTTAKAQLAYLMGNISLQDQYKFDEKWASFFNYPSEETTEYFKKLVPLMADLIEKKNQLTSAVIARDEAQKDADDAISNENQAAQTEALDMADQQTGIIKGLQQEMEALALQVKELGDPPNPLEKACKAKKKHEDAKKIVKNNFKATIIPNKLKGKINTEYKFKAEISEIAENAKLYWDFSDGENTTATPGQEVRHTFKKAGKFLVKLAIINPKAQDKAQIAESKALITGSNLPENKNGKNAGDTKFNFIAKDPFEISNLPEGCTVGRNEGSESGLVHASDSVKDNLYYTFNVSVSCKEKIFTKGEATLENMVKPVPFRIYATPATINLLVEYYPPDNILYKNRVESLSKLLGNQEDMKRWRYEPYNFKGRNANGRIVGYESVKNPLYKGSDRIRHEVNFYGIGQERTTVTFNINTLVGYFEDSFGIDCRKNGSYCGNVLENQIKDKFRDGLREKLETIRVTYYNDLEKLVAGMKLKGLPYPDTEASKIQEADDPWLNDDGTPLTGDELKRKQEALIEAEKFYKSNIEILQKNLAREQADYERENDPDRKAAFAFRIRAIKADIQAEQDKINTLYTGKIVHTRTEYDDYTHNKFVERVKEEQEKFIKIQKDRALLRKETNKLPAEEREKALKFINDQINEKTVADLDDEKVKKVAEAIFNKTQGYNEAEAAKYEEESLMWDDYLSRAEKVKFWSDIGMLGGSFLGGPMAVSAAYDITTGYFQGGPKEAATQILLQTGAFALGKYMSGAGKAAAGAEEALEAAKTASKQSKNIAKGISTQEELRIFQKNRKEGENIVKEFSNLNNDLKKAYLGKASKAQTDLIKKQIRDKAIEIQANPHAKNFLKYNNDKLTQVRFNRSVKNIHSDVEKKFYEKMKSDKYKWGDFEVKEMRNASSSGSVGMDYDIGLIEKSNFVKLPDGTMKPQYWLMKDGKPATRKLWQEEAQKCWNEAYKEVTLKDAGKSWENVTTKLHPESYQDLAVLDGNMSKVSKEWIQQTSDVTRYKSMHMMNDPSLSKFEKLQEISRGTAKDVNTKLMPLLGNMKNTKQASEAADHWKKVTSVLDDFGKNKMDPITAERRIAELTGGKSIPEVVDDMSYMMESIVKLGK